MIIELELDVITVTFTVTAVTDLCNNKSPSKDATSNSTNELAPRR